MNCLYKVRTFPIALHLIEVILKIKKILSKKNLVHTQKKAGTVN